MHFTDTITVYNHYKENGEDKYIRHIVNGVQWSHNRLKTTISGGAITESRVESITIDFEGDYNNPPYVNPIDFKNLSFKEPYWTLDSKSGQDILVLGIGSEIDSDYTIKKLKADHQYYGIVTEVSDNRNRDYLKTIKVVVK